VRWLADECVAAPLVAFLRAHGHDVLYVAEAAVGLSDADVIALALREKRLLLTEDKDFGWLAFAGHMDNPGVVLIRFPATARVTLAASVTRLASDLGPKLMGAFVVLRPGSVRISMTPHD